MGSLFCTTADAHHDELHREASSTPSSTLSHLSPAYSKENDSAVSSRELQGEQGEQSQGEQAQDSGGTGLWIMDYCLTLLHLTFLIPRTCVCLSLSLSLFLSYEDVSLALSPTPLLPSCPPPFLPPSLSLSPCAPCSLARALSLSFARALSLSLSLSLSHSLSLSLSLSFYCDTS